MLIKGCVPAGLVIDNFEITLINIERYELFWISSFSSVKKVT